MAPSQLDPFELLKLVLFKVTFQSAASTLNRRKLAIRISSIFYKHTVLQQVRITSEIIWAWPYNANVIMFEEVEVEVRDEVEVRNL